MALNPFKGFVKEKEFSKIKEAFIKIKENLDEHLDGINQNTNEIQSNYEYLCRLEAKLDSLNEKVAAVQLSLNELDAGSIRRGRIDLGYEEKKLFLAIYKYSSSKVFLSYAELGKRLNMQISLVRFYVTNLIEKNIPIVKRYSNREVLIGLDEEFRELQAKENIVNINESITRYI
jgi:hypothetical protein